MSRRCSILAALTIGVLATSPAAAGAQVQQVQPAPITVTFHNAPLRDVLKGMAEYSGRTIVMDGEIGNPPVNASFTNVEWRAALDRILEQQQLVMVEDRSGILVIRK